MTLPSLHLLCAKTGSHRPDTVPRPLLPLLDAPVLPLRDGSFASPSDHVFFPTPVGGEVEVRAVGSRTKGY